MIQVSACVSKLSPTQRGGDHECELSPTQTRGPYKAFALAVLNTI